MQSRFSGQGFPLFATCYDREALCLDSDSRFLHRVLDVPIDKGTLTSWMVADEHDNNLPAGRQKLQSVELAHFDQPVFLVNIEAVTLGQNPLIQGQLLFGFDCGFDSPWCYRLAAHDQIECWFWLTREWEFRRMFERNAVTDWCNREVRDEEEHAPADDQQQIRRPDAGLSFLPIVTPNDPSFTFEPNFIDIIIIQVLLDGKACHKVGQA